MAVITEEAVALSLDGRLLELIILPTEKCNFRCTYCYEDFAIGRMKPSTVNAIKKLIAARAASLRWLTLSWFGGEPLLAEGVICEIAEHAHALSEAHGFGLSGGLTTNGYLLTPDKVLRLHGLKHRTYQITLDGYDETHNRTRRLANGGPTFDRIWKNLLAIRDMDLDVEIMLRIHVSPHNAASLPILLSEIDRELSKRQPPNIN